MNILKIPTSVTSESASEMLVLCSRQGVLDVRGVQTQTPGAFMPAEVWSWGQGRCSALPEEGKVLRELPLPSTGTGAGGGLLLCCLLSSPGVAGGPMLASRPMAVGCMQPGQGLLRAHTLPSSGRTFWGMYSAFLSMFGNPRANKWDLSILVLLALRLEFMIIVYLICSLSH